MIFPDMLIFRNRSILKPSTKGEFAIGNGIAHTFRQLLMYVSNYPEILPYLREVLMFSCNMPLGKENEIIL